MIMKIKKRDIFSIGMIGTFVASTRGFALWCNNNDWNCRDNNDSVSLFFIIFLVVLIFSLITYFLREEIFCSWIKFTYFWIPISIFLVLIIPGGGGNGAFPSLIDKELVSILMSGLYFIISLTMIVFGVIKYYWFEK